jgi:hypothetical protein
VLRQENVRGKVADEVAGLARRVGDRRGPNIRAVRRAEKAGWLPPAAYEDDWSLPNPEDYEHLGNYSVTAERQDARREIVGSWTRAGRSAREIAEHLLVKGLSTGAVDNVMRGVVRDREALGLRAQDLDAPVAA